MITLPDLEQAQAILKATYDKNKKVAENIGTTIYGQFLNRITNILIKYKRLPRTRLLQAVSPYGCSADLLTKCLSHLAQQGEIRVVLDGIEKPEPSKAGREEYFYIGKGDDGKT